MFSSPFNAIPFELGSESSYRHSDDGEHFFTKNDYLIATEFFVTKFEHPTQLRKRVHISIGTFATSTGLKFGKSILLPS